MWNDTTPAISFSLIWLVAAFLLFLSTDRLSPLLLQPFRNSTITPSLLVVSLIALTVRLVPAIVLPVGATYDIDSFKLAGEDLLSGRDIYTSAAAGRHPYLPFQMYLIGISLSLSNHTGLPFVVLVKLWPIAADVLITAAIWFVARKWLDEDRALTLPLLYALNPVSLLVSAYHGQFDAIPVLFVVIAWIRWQFEGDQLRSAASIGLAILSKTWPAFLVPLFMVRIGSIRKQFLYGLIAICIPVLFTLAYVIFMSSNPEPMLRRSLLHRGSPGWWGPSALLNFLREEWTAFESLFVVHARFSLWILLVACFSVVWVTRKQALIDAIVTLILTVYVFTAGFGMQWTLWVLPFAILAMDIAWLRRYSIVVALVVLIPQLFGIHLQSWLPAVIGNEQSITLLQLLTIPAWIAATLWLLSRWRRLSAALILNEV